LMQYFVSSSLLPLLEHRADFSVSWSFTDGRTPWTGDQLIARPLPKDRITQTQKKRTHISNIHALSGIRSHDPGLRSSEDSTCLRPLGYRDRPWCTILFQYYPKCPISVEFSDQDVHVITKRITGRTAMHELFLWNPFSPWQLNRYPRFSRMGR
jgi:hypothetical protein